MNLKARFKELSFDKSDKLSSLSIVFEVDPRKMPVKSFSEYGNDLAEIGSERINAFRGPHDTLPNMFGL